MENFIATKYDSIEQKQKFAKQFIKFVESDFNRNKFPKWFYDTLHNTFGHIAHYNKNGFYNHFFSNLQDKLHFIEYTLTRNIYGDPEYTYSDVEKYLQTWLTDNNVLEYYKMLRKKQIEKNELEQLAYLKQKYEGKEK